MLPTPFPVPSWGIHVASAFLLCLVVLWSTHFARHTALDSRRRQALLVAVLIACTILGGSLFCQELGFHRALIGFLLSGALALGVFHPAIAASVLLSMLLLRPWELVPSGEVVAMIPRLAAGVAIVSVCLKKLGARDFSLSWNREVSCLAALLLLLCAGALASRQGTQGVMSIAESFFPIVVTVLVILNGVRADHDIRLIERSLVLAVAGMATIAFGLDAPPQEHLDTDGSFVTGKRLVGAGMWGNANDLAALIVLILPFAVRDMFLSLRHIVSWCLAFALVAVLLYGLAEAQSRGALIAFIAACFSFLAVRDYLQLRSPARVLGALCALALPAVLFLLMSRAHSDLEESASARLSYFLAGIGMAQDYPLLGVGFGNYPAFYERYATSFYEWGERTAHSSWILVLAEGGIPALMIFMTLMAWIVQRAWRLRARHPEYLVAVVGYGVAMSFLSHTYLLPPYLLLAIVGAASRSAAVMQKTKPAPTISQRSKFHAHAVVHS